MKIITRTNLRIYDGHTLYTIFRDHNNIEHARTNYMISMCWQNNEYTSLNENYDNRSLDRSWKQLSHGWTRKRQFSR